MSFYNLLPSHISYRPIILAEKEAVVTLQYSGHSADSLSAYRTLSVLDMSGRVHKPNLSKKSSQMKTIKCCYKKSSIKAKRTPERKKIALELAHELPR